jgi:hypothetical protein
MITGCDNISLQSEWKMGFVEVKERYYISEFLDADTNLRRKVMY